MSDTATPGAVEQLKSEDNVSIQVFGPDGHLKQETEAHNLVMTTGLNAIADQLVASPGLAKPLAIAIGTGAGAVAVGNTSLTTETARVAFTSKTRSTNVVTIIADYPAGTGTGAITEAAVTDTATASSGNLYTRVTFSAINKAAADTLKITWQITVS